MNEDGKGRESERKKGLRRRGREKKTKIDKT